jgi:hypothetical protein
MSVAELIYDWNKIDPQLQKPDRHIGFDDETLRDGDDGFFGVDSPVHVTLGLPTGVVQVRGLTARYARGSGAGIGFVVAVSITEIGGADAERFRTYLHARKLTA